MLGDKLFEDVLTQEELQNLPKRYVSRVVANSIGVEDGDVFVCLKGGRFNGRDYVAEALDRGASYIVCEEDLGLDNQVVVEDARSAFSLLCKNLSEKACEKLKIIGITGTNGKTTTANVLGTVLENMGEKVGVIGTLGVRYNGKTIDTGFTTPDPDILHRIFGDMVKCGVEYVVMEVSAHALALKKLEGVKFDLGILTNITQDHLDFFKTMENYANTKLSFFNSKYCKGGVVCADDRYARRLIDNPNIDIPIMPYGIDNPSDCFALSIKEGIGGCKFLVNCFDEVCNIESNLIGRFNIENLLAVITACSLEGYSLNSVAKSIRNIKPVEGRVNVIKANGVNIIIDYAHTPDGLENLLKTARDLTTGKLITLFGCGGNRDRGKRPIMGKVASDYSDHVILTSDNPRNEEPNEIIHDIARGVSGSYEIVCDRALAIKQGFFKCGEGDTLVIAGKGAEKTQEINGKKIEFSDYDEVYKNAKLRNSILGENS